MNKPLLTSALCAALCTANLSATVTIEGSETEYASVSEAIAAAETGATILVSESYHETTVLNPGDKAITIKGSTDDVVIYFKGQYVISLQNVNCSLTVNDITFRNEYDRANGRNTFAIGRGSLYLTNVTIDGADVNGNDNNSNPNCVISLNNSGTNIRNVLLDNVKIINSKVELAPAEVVVNNSNVTLTGDTELSMQLKGTNFIKDAAGFTGNVALVLDQDRADGSIIVRNCTDPSHFTLEGLDGKMLTAKDGNLVLVEIPAVLNETTGVGYSDFTTAFNAAKTNEVLVLHKDATLTDHPRCNKRILTVKGASGEEKIIRGESFTTQYFFVNNAEDDLTFENLVFDGNNVECTTSMFLPVNNAKLTLKNVTFTNSVTTYSAGMLANPNSNPGTWHLNGVKFVDCTAPAQLVTANAEGNSISGHNVMTLRINGMYVVDADGLDNVSEPVGVMLAAPVENQKVFINCDNAENFKCLNSDYKFVEDEEEGGIKFVKTVTTDVAEIEAAIANDAAVLYSLNGERVTNPRPGIYILRQGKKTTKVQLK